MSITSRINEMSSHIEQAYDELQGLGADLTNVNKNIENISMVLDDIYDSLPSVSGEGTSLTLDDTRVGKIKSTLKGNTSQTTYSGKNKLDLTGITTKPTARGLTITPSFNSNNELLNIKITGTPNNTDWIAIKNVSLPAGSYIMTGININDTTKTGIKIGLYIDNSRQWFIDVNNKVYNFTLNEQTSMDFVIWINNISTYPTGEIILTPMIRLSSVSDDTYEPYVGGTSSPNPDYPQDIHVVSGNNTIKVTGKNLAYMKNGTYTYNHNTGVISNNNIMTLNTSGSTSSDSYFSFANGYTTQWAPTSNIQGINDMNLTSNGGDYVATVITNKTMPSAVNIYFWTSKGRNWQRRIDAYTKVVATMSLDEDEHIKDIGIWVAGSPNVFENYTIQVQLEKGNTATDYEPYQGNTYNIDLPVENLYNGEVSATNQRLSTSTGGGYSVTGWSISSYVEVKPNTTYTISTKERIFCDEYDTSKAFIKGTAQAFGVTTPLTITTSNTTKYIRFDFPSGNESVSMVELGSKANSYTPYGTTPIELCKIGNYQDYFYKDSGKWYLHKEIGKVVLDGSETISSYVATSLSGSYQATFEISTKATSTDKIVLSNYFASALLSDRTSKTNIIYTYSDGYLRIATNLATTMADFKAWLSTHNVVVYYVLATPVNTALEDM